MLLGRGAHLVHNGPLGLVAVLLVLLCALLLGRVGAGDALAGRADGAQALAVCSVAHLSRTGIIYNRFKHSSTVLVLDHYNKFQIMKMFDPENTELPSKGTRQT